MTAITWFRSGWVWLGVLALGLFTYLTSARDGALPGSAQEQARPNNLVYEIFVRSFYDGTNDPHHIGDLNGVVETLDTYLNDGNPNTDHDLETGILWLMPVFPSPSHHGYDVTDYRTVNPDHGTLDDFKTLLQEAHRRGVRIILDIPLNHTSNEHPWFKGALTGRASPFHGFYHFALDQGPRPSGGHPADGPAGEKLRYFGLFSARMPDLNFDNPQVKRFPGLDGF